jgi:kumamolisin
MASSPKPMVKCKPYFRLRSRTPEFRPKSIVGADLAAAPSPWQVPALCAAYNWPTALPGNGVIAIVELGGGWVQSDMDAFFQGLNQPTPQITDISVDGTQNSPNQSVGSSNDADYEVALDIQVAAA